VSVLNARGETTLHRAFARGDTALAAPLLEAGADLDLAYVEGRLAKPAKCWVLEHGTVTCTDEAHAETLAFIDAWKARQANRAKSAMRALSAAG
jgi:ankyrin repeat protein